MVGPLHGLPAAHKDTFLTKGIRTTFGSPLYRDFVPEEDALIVEGRRRLTNFECHAQTLAGIGRARTAVRSDFHSSCAQALNC